jgi:hypothetical protein
MTEDTTPENLRKFLLSEDPAMRLMGISMAKGVDLPESNQIVNALSYWDTNEKVKEAANEKKEEEEDSEEEALGSFDYCPLWIKIYHIENASSSSHWPKALDYEATQFYELIVEMTSGKLMKEAKKEILHCLKDEWKAHTWYGGKDPNWGEREGTYSLATSIINLNEDLKSEIVRDACQVIEGIAENKDTLREGFSTDEANEGYPEDYFNIITEYGSKDDGNCILPLLACEDEDVRYTAVSALENLGMTKEELEDLGYEK